MFGHHIAAPTAPIGSQLATFIDRNPHIAVTDSERSRLASFDIIPIKAGRSLQSKGPIITPYPLLWLVDAGEFHQELRRFLKVLTKAQVLTDSAEANPVTPAVASTITDTESVGLDTVTPIITVSTPTTISIPVVAPQIPVPI
ncbi:hypothetical protein N7454_006256 [Penicillium verhagenii]|nr:hypothetical protein N7454_006256 [Penicillium verhagenii]